MRKPMLAVVTLVIVVLVGVTVNACGGGQEPPEPPRETGLTLRPGVAPPPQAGQTVSALLSPDPQIRRGALTPMLADAVGTSQVAPDGSIISLDSDGWREHDGFAVATATFTMPGQPARKILLGFQRDADRWLIAFQEDA